MVGDRLVFGTIAFDADDTLWYTERLYLELHARFQQLLERYRDRQDTARRAQETELRNLPHYGYGIKGFILSLVEVAVEVTDGRITGSEIGRVLDWGKEMAAAEPQLVEGARDVVVRLAGAYPLMLVTKGDLFEQEAKIARSGLRPFFRSIEIVSDKTCDSYSALLSRHGILPARFLMVGNSLRSDVLPVIQLGGWAAHIPYSMTWAHENVPLPDSCRDRCFELEHLGMLPGLIEQYSEALPTGMAAGNPHSEQSR